MDLSVVIATRNRRDSLARTLERLCRLPERPAVLVVDNASEDGTAELVRRRFPGVELVRLPGNAGAAARSLGVALADARYVAFSDDDSWWQQGALRRAAGLLDSHPRVAVVAARVLVGPRGALDPTCRAMEASPLPRNGLPGPAVLGFVACGAVVRRDAFLAAGGFHPRLGTGGEEQLLALDLARRGWRLVYAHDVVARHDPSPVRDAARRRRVQERNALWSAWLRRPLRGAAAAAAGHLRQPAVLADALRGLPWILRERRPVGPELEAQLRSLS